MTNPRAIELANQALTALLYSKAHFPTGTDEQNGIWRHNFLKMVAAEADAALAAHGDELLEDAAEICDNRNESGDTFAAQIRALKTQKQGAKG